MKRIHETEAEYTMRRRYAAAFRSLFRVVIMGNLRVAIAIKKAPLGALLRSFNPSDLTPVTWIKIHNTLIFTKSKKGACEISKIFFLSGASQKVWRLLGKIAARVSLLLALPSAVPGDHRA